jgi:hypothetical protein
VTDFFDFDWFILGLRLAFVLLLYLFLYQVVRVSSRELVELARRPVPSGPSLTPPRLTVVEPAESGLPAGTVIALQPLTTVGRNADCVLVLEEPFVSGNHAALTLEHDRWWLRDQGSTNGTFVNGARITGATSIQSGDIVQFGRVKLRFSS